MMTILILSCMSAVKILRLSWRTRKFIHLLSIAAGGGRSVSLKFNIFLNYV